MAKSVRVTSEDENGRNLAFKDNRTGQEMTRAQFVDKIRDGQFPDYHVRKVHGIQTPVSNPDKSEGNNLG